MDKYKVSNYGDLLAYATGNKLLAYKEYGSYSGDYIAVLETEDSIDIWKGYYGSCSGCDWLEATRNLDDGTVTKEQALKYIRDEKPFLTVEKRKVNVLLEAPDMSVYFPANTRIDYTGFGLDDLKEILKEAMLEN